MALDPRVRNPAGQFSAKGTLTARALRAAWSLLPRKVAPAAPAAPTAAFAAANTLIEFDAVCSTFTADKIDDVNAVIRGVSVITSGLIARGHDLEVDGVTLQQMQDCATSKGQVPVKVDHKSGAAAVCGFLTNFRQEENKLKADWFLLETHPQKSQILEVARRMPRGVGLSASFVTPEKPERTTAGKPAARCKELISVDYVTLPAANPDGMFAAKVDSSIRTMTPEQIQAAIDTAVSKAIAPLSEQLAAAKSQLESLQNPATELTLEEASAMDDAQLAALGLTKADVQEALEAAAQGEDAGADAGAGELAGAAAGEGAAAPGAGTAAAFAADVRKQLVELSTQIATLKGEKVVDAETALVDSLEKNFAALEAENTSLRQAIEAGGKPAAPGIDRNGIRYFSAGKQTGEFENLVQFQIEDKKLSKAAAFAAVIKENPVAHREYLVRSGVIAKAE